MKQVGYTLDIVLLCVTVYWLGQHPALQPLKTNGVLSTWAHDQYTALTPNGTFSIESLQPWVAYIVGDDVGSRAIGNSELQTMFEWNTWKNEIVLQGPLSPLLRLPHGLATWARNMIAGWALFYVVGILWSIWIYKLFPKHYFPNPEDIPSWEDVLLQCRVSTFAMIWYSLMPTISEWFMERGWTYAYYSVSDFGGWPKFLGWLAVYMFFVEWGIYWIHRYLHDNKTLYNLLHKPHHIYNNRNSLSPFAGLAFHPLDGMLQAAPYLIGLFMMPINFWMHEALLFFTGVWTAAIHDTITGDTEPIMGAGYHTIHHTAYKNNYGQVFVLFDWLHDTLQPPKHRREQWGWDTPTGKSGGAAGTSVSTKIE